MPSLLPPLLRNCVIKRWLLTLFPDGVQARRVRNMVLLDELVHHLEPYRPCPSRVCLRRIMRSQDRHLYAAGPDRFRGNPTIAQLHVAPKAAVAKASAG